MNYQKYLCRVDLHNRKDVVYFQSKDGKVSIEQCLSCLRANKKVFTFLWFSFWWNIKRKDYDKYGVVISEAKESS